MDLEEESKKPFRDKISKLVDKAEDITGIAYLVAVPIAIAGWLGYEAIKAFNKFNQDSPNIYDVAKQVYNSISDYIS